MKDMIRTLGKFSVDPESTQFKKLLTKEMVHVKSFALGDQLNVKFDGKCDGSIALSAHRPKIGGAHYRIAPVNMGAASWYNIEFDIKGSDLRNIGQVIPCLEAASPKSLTLFSVMRFFYKNGRSQDVSSAQIELCRNRRRQSFPIQLDDLAHMPAEEIDYARVIFKIEARNVDIELYDLTIMGVENASAELAPDGAGALRAMGDSADFPMSRVFIIPQEKDIWTGTASQHRALSDGVFIDFEVGEGRQVKIAQKRNVASFDFRQTAASGWRNLEFRFTNVKNTGAVCALLRASGAHAGSNSIETNVILREYDENFKWQDSPLALKIPLFSKGSSVQQIIDLSPKLADSRQSHTFGILLFFPPETTELQISELEMFVFDRML